MKIAVKIFLNRGKKGFYSRRDLYLAVGHDIEPAHPDLAILDPDNFQFTSIHIPANIGCEQKGYSLILFGKLFGEFNVADFRANRGLQPSFLKFEPQNLPIE